ncbi:MAG: IclR family transcriptional regulator [Alphaproteobacteria bacterium]|nr:IclR family transcriptional regulator [Alphaproteobacteria bacterium]
MSLDARYVVKPVRKALQLLDVLASEGRPLTLSELAERAALPKTTAFRYLYTLRSGGLVAQAEGSDAYAVGHRLAAIPAPEAAIEALKQAALPEMQRLQLRFNETVNLAIVDGDEVVYLAMVGSTRSLRMEAAVGARDPVHSTSLGKAILAARPLEHRLDGLPKRLAKRTPRTLASRAALALDLARAAEQGFALDLEENELGAHCVAVSIPGSGPPAALSISGPVQRVPVEALPRLGAALIKAAAAIAAKLG